MRKQSAPAPWQELEQQAYHAYREWPLWLVLRERELTERITHGRPPVQLPEPSSNVERKPDA